MFSFKGGVGKTTIGVNLAATLAAQGWRVLVVDGDPQANLTGFLTRYGYQDLPDQDEYKPDQDEYKTPQDEYKPDKDKLSGAQASSGHERPWWQDGRPGFLEPHKERQSAPIGGSAEGGLDVASFLNKVKTGASFEDLEEITLLNGYRKLGLVKGTPHIVDEEGVANASLHGAAVLGRLRKGLLRLGAGYDFVLIDLPPAISDLNKLFLTSSDYIIMPLGCDAYSGDTLWKMFQGSKESVLEKIADYMKKGSEGDGGINTIVDAKWDTQLGNTVPTFERNVNIFPILLNRCQKGLTYQSMGKFPTMWYNGYKDFLNSCPELPPGFAWVDDETRVLGAFNDSAALIKRQAEKLPVVLSKSLSAADVTLRNSLLALSSMIVVTVREQLKKSNPRLMSICEARGRDGFTAHGFTGKSVIGCFGQVIVSPSLLASTSMCVSG